jgi:hypothetical protein
MRGGGKSERGIIMYIGEMQDSYYVNSYIGDLIYYLLTYICSMIFLYF